MPKSILLISSEFPPGPGGIGQHAHSLCKALLSKGCKVIVQTEGDYASLKEIKSFDNNARRENIYVNRNRRRRFFTYSGRFYRTLCLLSKHRPNLVILSGRFSLFSVFVIRLINKNQPIFAFVHGSEVANKNSLITKCTYLALSQADKILAVSQFTSSLLPTYLLHKTEIIPNGLNFGDMPDIDHIKEFKDWIGFPKLITVGNLTRRKGQHRVLNAMPLLLKHYPHLHYHMVGLDTERSQIEKQANKLGIHDSITIHGRLNNRQDLYRAYLTADIFIMLSENQGNGDVEGFGIAILEANYFGLGAIGARGSGISEAIKDKYSGVLVDGDDAESIRAATKYILQRKSKFKNDSKTWALTHDWEKIIDKVLIT